MALHRRRTALLITAIAGLAFVGAAVPLTSSVAATPAPAPRLVSPANETNTAIKDLVLDWQPVEGASGYQVQLSRNADWTNNVVYSATTKATLLEMPIGLAHSTYFWRVRAIVGGLNGAWSQVWQFLREWEAPIHVIHVPTSTDPTLSWAPVPDASIYHIVYNGTGDPLDVSDSSGCWTANTSFTPGTGGKEVTVNGFGCNDPALVDGMTYQWALAAFDDSDSASIAPNGTDGCGTKIPECDYPAVTGSFTWHAPAGGSGTQLTGLQTTWHAATSTENVCTETLPCPTTPTFSWDPVPGADVYFVDVYVDRDATTLYREYNTQTSTITPPDQFQDAQPNKPYYWRVDATTCGGPGVSCTPPTAASQGCPALSSGTSGSSPSSTPSPSASPTSSPAPAPTVTGVSAGGSQTMQGGTTKTVTISGTNISSGACVKASGGVVTTVPSVVNNTMTFSYWAPVDGGSVTFTIENPDGQTSAASPAINVLSSTHSVALSALQLFQKRSGPVTLESPANDSVVHGQTLTFKWDDYIASGSSGTFDPKSYELEVAKDPTFDDVLLDKTDIDLTQYTPPAGFTGAGHLFWRVNAIDESGNQLTWSSVRQVTINTVRPTVDFATKDGVHVSKPLKIKFSHVVKGVSAHTLKVVPAGQSLSHALAGTLHLGSTPTQYVFTPNHVLATGGRYVLWVSSSVVDENDNSVIVSDRVLRTTTQGPNRSKGWTFSGGWTRHQSTGSLSGTDMEARSGAAATIQLEGQNVNITGCTGPAFGKVRFSIAGISHTVDEHRSYTRCGIYVWRSAFPAGIHTLRIRVISGTGSFDGLAVR